MMANVSSGSSEDAAELPPSYEQALEHRRLEGSYPLPGYPLESATRGPGFRRFPEVRANRTYQLPSTDLTRGRSPEVVSEYDTVSTLSSSDENMNSCLKLALPPMHMCIAITCLVVNIILPGLGTMMASCGVCCCTKPNHWQAKEKCQSCSLCLLIGLLQLILVPVILLGWIWSIIWGLALLGVSLDEYHGMKNEEDDEEAVTITRPRSAFFRNMPRPATTRQAIRQTTSQVSPGPTEHNTGHVESHPSGAVITPVHG